MNSVSVNKFPAQRSTVTLAASPIGDDIPMSGTASRDPTYDCWPKSGLQVVVPKDCFGSKQPPALRSRTINNTGSHRLRWQVPVCTPFRPKYARKQPHVMMPALPPAPALDAP